METMTLSSSEQIEIARKNLSRRGFQVVEENGKLRFIGGDPDVLSDIEEALGSKEDNTSRLTNLLNAMGFDVDVEGRYLVAFPAL